MTHNNIYQHTKGKVMRQILASTILVFMCGCANNNQKTQIPTVDGQDNAIYYSLEHPISLNPAITSAMNGIKATGELGFDSDLLGLASSITKIQTYKLAADGSTSIGIFNFTGKTERYKTTFDTVMYASYPVNILVKEKSSQNMHQITVVPLIGSGVRVVANYESNQGGLSAPIFNTNVENINGAVQIQLLGVNRLGANGAGFSQFNLTPESISIMKEQVATIMSQMWLKNTIIQPKIVGYTVLSPIKNVELSPATLIPQILEQVPSLSDYFFETQVMELYQLGKIAPKEISVIRAKYNEAKMQTETSEETYIVSEMIRLLIEDRDWKKSQKTKSQLVADALKKIPNFKFKCIGSASDWQTIQDIVHDVINNTNTANTISCQ